MDRVEQEAPARHLESAKARLESRSDWFAVRTVLVLLIVGIGAVCFVLIGLKGAVDPQVINTWIGYGMYAVMFVTIVVALVRMVDLVRYFVREKQLAFEDLEHLWYGADGDSVGSFADAAKQRGRTGLFADHIVKLNAIAKQHGQVDQTVLIEVMHARLSARNKGLELLGSTLVTMGLIGTIFGLVFLTNGMADVMLKQGASPNVIEALFAEGTGPMYGLGFAFYTTLLGAFAGGIVLRFFSLWLEARISDFVATIAELTEVDVLPRVRRERDEAEHRKVQQA